MAHVNETMYCTDYRALLRKMTCNLRHFMCLRHPVVQVHLIQMNVTCQWDNVTQMIHMTHACVTWIIHMGHDSFIWDMTHSSVTWLVNADDPQIQIQLRHIYGTHEWANIPHVMLKYAHIHIWNVNDKGVWRQAGDEQVQLQLQIQIQIQIQLIRIHVTYECALQYLTCERKNTHMCIFEMRTTKVVVYTTTLVIWMSYVRYEWVTSHMNESCPIWMSHVMSHMNESYPIWISHVPCEWVMSHMNESRPIWMSHVTHDWVMLHLTVSCTIACVLSYMSHVTNMNESCHAWQSHM